jgi:hypothetical protein|tara:strand:+ start:51820 stop:52116 length:297 start_codon:yes stop_codon:yes gene_type:complete
MQVKIFKPSKNTMQSGLAKTKNWRLEFVPYTERSPEPLMGWTQSGDTTNQVKLSFPSCDEAISYAQKMGWEWTVEKERKRKILPRNYADSFKYVPIEE